jgi:hypothetical protein
MPLTRRAARFGGDIAADYTVAVFKPSLDPNMADSVRQYRETELHQQLLKNRGGNVLHLGGVPHHVDVSCWKITEIPKETHDNQSAIGAVVSTAGHPGMDQWPAPGGSGEIPQAG